MLEVFPSCKEMLNTPPPFLIAETATYPCKPRTPPPYTRLIFLTAIALLRSTAADQNSVFFSFSIPPTTQILLNIGMLFGSPSYLFVQTN